MAGNQSPCLGQFINSHSFTNEIQAALDLQKLDNTKKALFSRNEVAQHIRESDIWVIIENDIYDQSQFLHKHPGGVKGNLIFCENTVECTISQAFDSSTRSRRPRCNEEIQEDHHLGILGKYKELLLRGELEPTAQGYGSLRKSSIFTMFRRP